MSQAQIGSLLGRIGIGSSLSSEGGSKGKVPGLQTSEERLASRFSSIRGLNPPVDVISVARTLADVSEKVFPVSDVDGLCLDLKKPGVKPRIWINKDRPYTRRRFTIAHEIGHIVIPWHTGSIVDDLDSGASDQDEYRRTEGQANRFAAELLMPKAWAQSLCDRADHLCDAMHAIRVIADVSFHAAALRSAQVGPTGYLLAAVHSGVVDWVGKTPGTRARAPVQGTNIDEVDMPAFEKPAILNSPNYQYYFWREMAAVEPAPRPAEPWRETLERMLASIPVQHRPVTRQRVNAIVGNALGRAPRDSLPEVFYQRVLEALQNRHDRDQWVASLVRHPDITTYVTARVYDQAEKNKQSS